MANRELHGYKKVIVVEVSGISSARAFEEAAEVIARYKESDDYELLAANYGYYEEPVAEGEHDFILLTLGL